MLFNNLQHGGNYARKTILPKVSFITHHNTEKAYEKPQPAEAVIIELDEMWHYIKSKKQTLDMEILLS